MPSPIGHALSGVAIAWSASLAEPRDGRGRTLADRWLPIAVVLAAAPDLDLLVHGAHRTATHSVTAMLLVTIVAAAVTGQVTSLGASRFGGHARWRVALLCGLSYGSHLLLDWLAADNYPPRGIQLLWPFSSRWFISDLDLFRQTARQEFFTAPIIRQNLVAVAQEGLILLPILAVLAYARLRQQRQFRSRN
jgi:inner membrane protein